MHAVQVDLLVHPDEAARVDFEGRMRLLLDPLVEDGLEVGAYFLELRSVKISVLIQVEFGCVPAQEKVESQGLVVFIGGRIKHDVLHLLFVLLDDGIVDVPAVGLDHVGEEYAFELVD